jgi:hypothetical protein
MQSAEEGGGEDETVKQEEAEEKSVLGHDELAVKEEDDEEEEAERQNRQKRTRRSTKKNDKHPWIFQELGASYCLYENCRENPVGSKTTTSKLSHAPWAARHVHGEVSSDLQAKLIHSSSQSFRRCHARWYYPMDFPIVQAAMRKKSQHTVTTTDSEKNRHNPTKKSQRLKRIIDKAYNQKTASSRQEDLTREELRDQTRAWNALDPLMNIQQPQHGAFSLIDQAREVMLDTAHAEDNNDVYLMHNQPHARPDYHWADYYRSRSQKRQQLLQSYQLYDRTPYLKAQWRNNQGRNKLQVPELCLNDRKCKGSQYFAQQRMDCSDPAYLAPFPLNALMEALQDGSPMDVVAADQRTKKKAKEQHHASSNGPTNVDDFLEQRRREIPASRDSSSGGTNGGNHIGNCIVCVPCSCPVCSSAATTTATTEHQQHQEPNWCLLHPIGEMMEIVAASLLKTPRGCSDEAILKTRRMAVLQSTNKLSHKSYNELFLGDTIRQIEQCGDSTIFLARTTMYVTVFSVVPTKDDSFPRSRAKFKNDKLDLSSTLPLKSGTTLPPLCWGTFRVTELQKIDLRSLDRHSPAYLPVHVTSHPKFSGSLFTGHQIKFAILSHCPGKSDGNTTIHHFLWAPTEEGKEKSTGPRTYCTKHIIRNLRSISQIIFSRRHPMILWASALSFARPTPTPDHATRNSNYEARLAHGHALYEIDLRKDEATFRWSPSAAECVVEAVHSISCIAVNWKKSCNQSTLWVYSWSAGKMWELDDTFSALRVVNCWTLPSQCDNVGQLLNSDGTFGAKGALIAKPTFSSNTDSAGLDGCPFFSVLVGTAAFGVQLFQPPLKRPAFQTDNLEIASSPALPSEDNRNFALSSVFAFPHMSGRSVTCGLASIMLPSVGSLLSENDVVQAGLPDDGRACLNCVVTVNSHGVVRAQILLGTRDGKMMCPLPDRFPVGSREQPLIAEKARHQYVAEENKLAGGMNLYLSLHGAQPQQRRQKWSSTGRLGADEQNTLRPFKFSDLRHLPPTISGGDCDHMHDVDSGTIQPIRRSHDVVVCRQAEALQHSSGAAREFPPHTCESRVRSFKLVNESDALSKSRTSAPVDGRSDVTKQVLDSVKDNWKSNK